MYDEKLKATGESKIPEIYESLAPGHLRYVEASAATIDALKAENRYPVGQERVRLSLPGQPAVESPIERNRREREDELRVFEERFADGTILAALTNPQNPYYNICRQAAQRGLHSLERAEQEQQALMRQRAEEARDSYPDIARYRNYRVLEDAIEDPINTNQQTRFGLAGFIGQELTRLQRFQHEWLISDEMKLATEVYEKAYKGIQRDSFGDAIYYIRGEGDRLERYMLAGRTNPSAEVSHNAKAARKVEDTLVSMLEQKARSGMTLTPDELARVNREFKGIQDRAADRFERRTGEHPVRMQQTQSNLHRLKDILGKGPSLKDPEQQEGKVLIKEVLQSPSLIKAAELEDPWAEARETHRQFQDAKKAMEELLKGTY